MSKERELLQRLVSAELNDIFDLLVEAQELLAKPEQEPFIYKDRELTGSLIAHDAMYKKGYARGFDVAREDYKQKVISVFGVDDE
jgi:hypothetical protein